MSTKQVPQAIALNPTVGHWLAFDFERQQIVVYSGKVELGQGIGTALAQIAADELGVELIQVRLIAGDTRVSPDEWYTAGSLSVELGGTALRQACGTARGLFEAAAAKALNVAVATVHVLNGCFRSEERPGDFVTYWGLARGVDLNKVPVAERQSERVPRGPLIGSSQARLDLPAKVTGAAFIHDIELPGMVHGRIMRPPGLGCELLEIDRDAIRALNGVLDVYVDGSLVAVVAAEEYAAVRAAEAGGRYLKWSAPRSMPPMGPIKTLLHESNAGQIVATKQDPGAGPHGVATISASFSRPYLAHASVGTCCAVAFWDAGILTIFSHSQGPHFLRSQLAKALRMRDEDVAVVHRDGAGCYGHNGADDVALEAALLCRYLQRPVMLTWTREEELTWSPFGSAMRVDVSADLNADGEIAHWSHQVWSHTHMMRPGWGDGVNLLAAAQLASPALPSTPTDIPLPAGGGDRNAVPLYQFPSLEVVYHFVPSSPVRVSALRTLGAFANVFAIECFMDEISQHLDIDPIEFRQKHLRDPRARRVIADVVAFAGWEWRKRQDQTGDCAVGRGFGFAQYKNLSAYCAIVADVEVAEAVRVMRVWAAVDAGEVVNPDGLRNQIEGGILQAISWTLKEQVTWDQDRVTSGSWETYPILTFEEVPDVKVLLIESGGAPSLGVGECAGGPTAAAISNAIWDAIGVRVRNMPLTPESISAAM